MIFLRTRDTQQVHSIGYILNERNEKRKEKHGWMYRQVADALSELSDSFAWQEYDELVRKTFEE